jgi:hypothetical protein
MRKSGRQPKEELHNDAGSLSNPHLYGTPLLIAALLKHDTGPYIQPNKPSTNFNIKLL